MAYISQEAMDIAKLQRRRDSLHHTLLISLRAEEDAESCLYQAMSPVKVFGSAAFTNVARVLVCLEEVGAQYEVVDVDFLAKEHKGTEHLAKNVPAFQDGDLMLFQSRAICRYVLRKYRTPEGPNLLGDSDLAESALVDAWLDVEAVQYEPAVHAVFVQHRVVPALGGTPDEEAIRESVEKLRKVLGVYEARLGERRYHGRRRRQPGRPEPLPLHALPHGDAVRGGVRRVPSRKCVVAGPRGPAGGA